MLSHLILMRHAKSSWTDQSATDHERILTKRGRDSADAVGSALSARGFAPELIWASDSARTRETATRLIRKIPGSQHVVYGAEFYHAGPDEVLAACAQNGEPDVARLMILGHNPGWAMLYEMFSGRYHDFPTGACAVFKRMDGRDTHWLSPESWRAIDLILPRQLLS